MSLKTYGDQADAIPAGPGTYALVLHLEQAKSVQIGRLGLFPFPAGDYIYIGSALGSGGLAGRLQRHLAWHQLVEACGTQRPSLRWHIDYLHPKTWLHEMWYLSSRQRYEHQWAQMFANKTGISIPAPGFGASDCSCPSHLFCVPTASKLRDAWPNLFNDYAKFGALRRVRLINRPRAL